MMSGDDSNTRISNRFCHFEKFQSAYHLSYQTGGTFHWLKKTAAL